MYHVHSIVALVFNSSSAFVCLVVFFLSMAILFYKYMHLDRIRTTVIDVIRSINAEAIEKTSLPTESHLLMNNLESMIWCFCLSSISLVLSLLIGIVECRATDCSLPRKRKKWDARLLVYLRFQPINMSPIVSSAKCSTRKHQRREIGSVC